MGCDYDGDTVTVFRDLPGGEGIGGPPSRIAWDEVRNRPVFSPTKQYLYGLHLLHRSGEARVRLDAELRSAGAPGWPSVETARDALRGWLGEAAVHAERTGAWWGVVERHALEALAEDPGMGLGLHPPERIGGLDVVRCGAAKEDVFRNFVPGSETYHAYTGDSLGAFRPGSARQDTIATVMAAAGASVGHFGNVPRRLLYSAKVVDQELVRLVHALSEAAYQRTLSVKTGGGPLNFRDFRRHILDPLLKGRVRSTPRE
jgi:hypothetical protein